MITTFHPFGGCDMFWTAYRHGRSRLSLLQKATASTVTVVQLHSAGQPVLFHSNRPTAPSGLIRPKVQKEPAEKLFRCLPLHFVPSRNSPDQDRDYSFMSVEYRFFCLF